MLNPVRLEKVHEKIGVICIVSMFPSVLKLPPKNLYLQFCTDLSKKSNFVKLIYIYCTKNEALRISSHLLKKTLMEDFIF